MNKDTFTAFFEKTPFLLQMLHWIRFVVYQLMKAESIGHIKDRVTTLWNPQIKSPSNYEQITTEYFCMQAPEPRTNPEGSLAFESHSALLYLCYSCKEVL